MNIVKLLAVAVVCLDISPAWSKDYKEHQLPCNDVQTLIVKDALLKAQNALKVVTTELGNDQIDLARYTKWFGAPSSDSITKVKEVYSKALAFSSFQRFWCPLSSTMDLPWNVNEAAAVLPDDDPLAIYFAIPFFSLNDQGPDSRAGTIVHELTHQKTVGSTSDHAYGQPAAKKLASQEPGKARRNADNYQYYLEDVFFGI